MDNISTIGFNNNISKNREVSFTRKNTGLNKDNNPLKKSNWRESLGPNYKVNDNVLLIPDNSIIKVSSKISLSDYNIGGVGGKTYNVGNISQMAGSINELNTGVTVLPKYNSVVFEKADNLELSNEITFTFRYGNAGLFNAVEEVVKPINCLCKYFGVESETKKVYDINVQNIILPFPSNERAMFNQFKNLVSLYNDKNEDFRNTYESIYDPKELSEDEIKKNNKGKSDEEIKKEEEVNKLNKNIELHNNTDSINQKIQKAIAASAKAELDETSNYGIISIKYGNIRFDYVAYTTIKWELNYKHLDENGTPMEGKFTLGGLQSLRKGVKDFLREPLDYAIDSSGLNKTENATAE